MVLVFNEWAHDSVLSADSAKCGQIKELYILQWFICIKAVIFYQAETSVCLMHGMSSCHHFGGEQTQAMSDEPWKSSLLLPLHQPLAFPGMVTL